MMTQTNAMSNVLERLESKTQFEDKEISTTSFVNAETRWGTSRSSQHQRPSVKIGENSRLSSRGPHVRMSFAIELNRECILVKNFSTRPRIALKFRIKSSEG